MPFTADSLDIMAVLKTSTATKHKAVEHLMPFFNEQFSLETYSQTIALFLGFFGPIEQKLASVAGWEAIGIDLRARSRAHLLLADLGALGYAQSHIANLPRCQDLPAIQNCIDGLGCMYVLEGSTLGGQLIARELASRLGIGENSGAAFFHSHGGSVGSMWVEFCASVRNNVHTLEQQRAAVIAAEDTFTCFSSWMGRKN